MVVTRRHQSSPVVTRTEPFQPALSHSLAEAAGFVATVYGVCVAADDEYCGTSDEMVLQTLMVAGVSAAIGAGIGALNHLSHKSEDVLYFAARDRKTMSLAPIVSPTRKGVAFSMSWR